MIATVLRAGCCAGAVALAATAPALVPAGVATAVPAAAPVTAPSEPVGQVVYGPPAPLRVVRGFDPPAGPYGPGHRGVDLASGIGAAVVSAADGVVTFAGVVAGRPLVVVRHADGVRTEYEPVAPAVSIGAHVSRGQVLGHVEGRHHGCAAACLHWGARRGTIYLDPLLLLRRLGRVRLLPWSRGP